MEFTLKGVNNNSPHLSPEIDKDNFFLKNLQHINNDNPESPFFVIHQQIPSKNEPYLSYENNIVLSGAEAEAFQKALHELATRNPQKVFGALRFKKWSRFEPSIRFNKK